MKNIVFTVITSTLAVTSLFSATQAVVFDWGDVMGSFDRSLLVEFMCDSFHFTKEEFEQANREKWQTLDEGRSDVDFWLEFASKRRITLPETWDSQYLSVFESCIDLNPSMYALVGELTKNKVQIALLSNATPRQAATIRKMGLYKPFDPCLLSCEIGIEKPDLKAYSLLLTSLRLSGPEILFIDDRPENVEAAKKIGIDALLFESPEQLRKELLRRELLK